MEFVVCVLVLLNIFFGVILGIFHKKIKRLEKSSVKFESLKTELDSLKRSFVDPKTNFRRLQEALKDWGDNNERNNNG